MEKVSVIIPTYNRADTIYQSVKSVLEQTYQDLEVWVIDDASTDDTAGVVEKMEDPRVHYFLQEHNGGAAKARNTGVKLADTEWIAFHDSDDVWRPDKLEKQMAYAKEHPEYDLIYGAYLLHPVSGDAIHVPADMPQNLLSGDMYRTLLEGNVIGAPVILMKRDVFWEVDGFDTTWECLEDWDFVLRVSKSHLIGYVEDVLLDAYQSPGSVSSNVGGYYNCRCRLIAGHRQEMEKMGIFDVIVMDLFSRAQKAGILEIVQKMLMQHLAGTVSDKV